MKNIIKNKKTINYLAWFILTLNFFFFCILMSWDSTVYLGMSLVLGTPNLNGVWLPVRGIIFPFLLRLFEPFGFQNKYLLLLLLYIFYLELLHIVYQIGHKLNLYNNKIDKYTYTIFTIIFVIINPLIFVYYHLILTEFIAITLNMLFVYLMYNYIRIDIRKNKKISYFYIIYISLIMLILYHTKQSFVGMILIELFLSIFISFFRYFDYKNILYRISTIIICFLLLFSSIKVWNSYSNTKGLDNIGEKSYESYTNKHIINGLTRLREIGNNYNTIIIDNKIIRTNKVISKEWTSPDSIELKNQEFEEIKNVLNKKSIYKGYSIYEDKKNPNKKYVFFTKNNYSLTEQLPLYFKIFITIPNIVINSYYDGLYKTVWTEGYWAFENQAFVVQYYYYNDNDNITESTIAPGYEFAVEDLKEEHHSTIIDNMAFGFSQLLFYIYRINQMFMPILFIISFIFTIYIIILNKKGKVSNNIRNGFEMSFLLYSMSFGCILSYIMFGAFIDRYLIPSHIPMYIGDILFIIYLIKFIKDKKKALVSQN